MTALFPPIEPFNAGMLPVGDGHEIYFEESGNPRGRPVIIVHGGPGGGSNPTMRRYHDPAHYRIVLFDQRGCGRSRPNASLEANTTWHLVADMERIRTHLGIDRWQLFGGSWGSTLSLAYAETHPERVTEMVLRGIFTLRRAELLWFYQEGASWIYPDTFEPYRDFIPEAERSDMIAAYYRRLTDPDLDLQIEAARRWSMWEGSALSLIPDPERVRQFGADSYARAFARIECHYFVNRGFFERDDQLLANVDRIRGIPGVIVHGRYDICTPLKIGHDLKKAWPEADFRIVADAGHAMSEPGIVRELMAAARRFAGQAMS
ncbi:MAG: prolyl aminopeptidase [Hyphomicrobiaceae bacterium]